MLSRPAMFLQLTITLVHPPDHSVDLILPVASVTSLHKVCGLLVHTTAGWRQLEGPQEVVGGLEVLSNCVNLMDEVLNTDDAIFACGWKGNMLNKFNSITARTLDYFYLQMSEISKSKSWYVTCYKKKSLLLPKIMHPNGKVTVRLACGFRHNWLSFHFFSPESIRRGKKCASLTTCRTTP